MDTTKFAKVSWMLAEQFARANGHAPRASLILPRLYLSDLATARRSGVLLDLKVTHIVSVMERAPKFTKDKATTERCSILHVPLQDSFSVDVLSHLDETTAFIREALAQEDAVVLVRASFAWWHRCWLTDGDHRCIACRASAAASPS